MNRLGRQLVVGLCAALIALGCYTTSGPRSVALAAGSPNISLAESAPGTVLYGASSTVTLTVTNPAGGSWAYNLSYEDVLPSGVSYVAGSASLGNPAILSNQPSANKTTLIWSNVSDLSPGSVATLTFKVIAATDTGPAPFLLANNTYTDNSSAYVNTDPRQVPQFSANGTVSNFTGSASAIGNDCARCACRSACLQAGCFSAVSMTTRRCTRSRSPTTRCMPPTALGRRSICRPASRICSAVRRTTRPGRRPTLAAPRNIRAAARSPGTRVFPPTAWPRRR